MQDFEPRPSAGQVSETNEQAQMALLSHDIRSAVSDVIGGLRLVDLEALTPEVRLQLERVRTAGEVLARLTEEVLSAVTHDVDASDGISSNLHLFRLMNNIRLRWSGRANEKGLKFIVALRDNLPALISINRLALERVLSNLLSNAIKYTETGTVTLTVGLCETDCLCFDISDEGPGFSQQALETLFQYEGRPDTNKKPGTGLGLHIAKEITDELGGILLIRNRKVGGAITSLKLPPSVWRYCAETVGSNALPDLTNFKVLIAEDNETNQLIIAQMMDVMGAEYEIARDGVEALNWLERESFDFALIDIDMPRLSGIDVMHAMRSGNSHHRDLPVLAITAYVLRANREAIYRAGANRILAKPIMHIDALGKSITALINATQDLQTGTLIGPPAAPFSNDSFQNLLDIVGPQGADELLTRLIADLENVRTQLSAAVAATDKEQIRAQTHILISLAGAVGAEHLQSLATVLNTAAHNMDPEAIKRMGAETSTGLTEILNFIRTKYTQRTEGAND